MFEEGRLVAAREVDVNEIRFGILDFQDVWTIIRCVRCNQLVRHHLSTLSGQKTGGDPSQIMTKGIVSREHVEILTLHISSAILPVTNGLGVHGIPSLDMESKTITLRAPECIRITPGLHIHCL